MNNPINNNNKRKCTEGDGDKFAVQGGPRIAHGAKCKQCNQKLIPNFRTTPTAITNGTVATNATTTTATITTTTTVPPSSASASNSSNNITVTPTTTKTLKRKLPSSSSSSGDTTINVDDDATVYQALITKKTVTSLTTTTSSPVTTVTTTSVNVATTMRKKAPSPYSVVGGSPPSVTTNATTTAATPRTSTTFDDGTTTITIDNNSNALKVGKFEDEIKGYDNFDFFRAALDQAGLKNTLKRIGPYTLLAPTDAACFAYKGCLDEDILKYHIILGKHDSNSFSTTDNLKTYETLNGESITYTRKYQKDFLDDAEIGQTSYPCDIECGNGVIHSIDRVLIPGYTFNNNCDICNFPIGGGSRRCYNVLACGIRYKKRAEEQKIIEKVRAAKEKIRDDKKAETERRRAKKAETERRRAEKKRRRKQNREDGITSTSTYLFDHQKPTKTPTTEVLHDVEYNKRFVRPYICGGFVYSPSKGVSTDNLVVALIKEIMLLLDQKLLTTTDVLSALFHKRTIQDGAYIQLNLVGAGADRILQNFKNIAPIICFLIKKWKNNPDTSNGDKMLIYPPGASTDTHIDSEKTHRINLHFGEEKTLMLVKDKQLSTIYDELICKPNCEYQIYGGNRDMFCNPTICFHKGMIKGKSAGFTIVTNPQSNEIALGRPAFLSDVFLELNSLVLVEDLKCSSQSVEYYSHLLKEKFSTYREKL